MVKKKCSFFYRLNARINLLIGTIPSATYSQLVAWARSYHVYQDHVNPLVELKQQIFLFKVFCLYLNQFGYGII